MSESRTYSVSGMTCSHCVAAVSSAVGNVPGVSSVEVDLDSGSVAVRGEALDDELVRSAVSEAGYEVLAPV